MPNLHAAVYADKGQGAPRLRVINKDAPPSVEEWLDDYAFCHWVRRGKPLGDDWSDRFAAERQLEREFASAQGENQAWLEANRATLLVRHPDWEGKYVAVLSRSDEKVLAVADEWDTALQRVLESDELSHVADRDKLPALILPSVTILGDC